MGWFWAEKTPQKSINVEGAGLCPIDHGKYTSKSSSQESQESQCPVNYGNGSWFSRSKKSEVSAKSSFNDGDEVLNPMNNMPMAISSEKAPGQKITLPTERTISTIPRGETPDQGLWEYPSPQQMYNAMLRKGKGEGIPEDAVESMVEVHNFLNEGAWQQILGWEQKYTSESKVEPRLAKFTGKPNTLSPRAQMFLYLGKVFPETFNTQPPFDRHDWTVLRSQGKDQGWKEVRYIIDYYSAPDDEDTGMPAFMLDTRPALDSPQNAYDRFNHWASPIWQRAMGNFEEK